MFFKTMTQSSGAKAGLSVAFLALMSGMALAQDLGLGEDGTISILPAEDVVLTDPAVDIGDEIVPDEIIPDDPGAGIGDEIVLDDEIIDIGDGGEPEPCTGCEPPPEEDPTDPGWPDDGVSPMPEIEDPVAEGGDVSVDETGEVTIYDLGEFPESTCGGCEFETMAGGPDVLQVRTANGSAGFDAATDSVRNDSNICFDADLYVPLLCDWQRPFLGDRMP